MNVITSQLYDCLIFYIIAKLNILANAISSAATPAGNMNMLRVDSCTGLTALRIQDGLGQRNSSVEDFLSLMASGDIPHQDPHLLNVPFSHGNFPLLHQNNIHPQTATFLTAQQPQTSHLPPDNSLNIQIISTVEGSGTGSLKKRKAIN